MGQKRINRIITCLHIIPRFCHSNGQSDYYLSNLLAPHAAQQTQDEWPVSRTAGWNRGRPWWEFWLQYYSKIIVVVSNSCSNMQSEWLRILREKSIAFFVYTTILAAMLWCQGKGRATCRTFIEIIRVTRKHADNSGTWNRHGSNSINRGYKVAIPSSSYRHSRNITLRMAEELNETVNSWSIQDFWL